jgi:alkaline phosphatase D
VSRYDPGVRFTRRQALRTGAVAAASWLAPACAEPVAPTEGFAWGVASGDPTARSVILWTRLAVEVPTEVRVEVFRDPEASDLVVEELALADPERDGCVKIDVEGLVPATTYYYRFSAPGAVSDLGRTRTLPEGAVDRVRLAFVTCTNLGYGFFHGYRRLAERADLAMIVHLGDTMYEYAEGVYGALRALDPVNETVTLPDYRRRYAWYRGDADLREAFRQHPVLPVWDDHEFANNAHRAGALEHDPALEGTWEARVAAARRAFFEWYPVRDETRVHRVFTFGDLSRVALLDTRMDGRDPPPASETERVSPDRRIASADQEAWLRALLAQGDVVHTLLGNQVVLAPFLTLGNLDAWDGFPAQQGRILSAIASAPSLVSVLTGDTHSSLCFDLPGPDYDPTSQRGSTGVEWGTPALASPHFTGEESRAMERFLLEGTPHLRWTEQEAKGYVLLDLDRGRARAEWWFIEDATRPDGGAERLVRVFEQRLAERASREVDAVASPAIDPAPPLAP